MFNFHHVASFPGRITNILLKIPTRPYACIPGCTLSVANTQQPLLIQLQMSQKSWIVVSDQNAFWDTCKWSSVILEKQVYFRSHPIIKCTME